MTPIDTQIARLAQAIGAEWNAEDEGEAPGGPFSQLKHRLSAFSSHRVLKLKNLRNSWLHALVCMVQEEEMEGAFILPGVLPPAAMLAQGFTGPDDQRAILAAGFVACIRPPNNELLLLSPANAQAAVYELGAQGLVKLADSVVDFFAKQIDLGLAPLEHCDEGQLGALVVGRRFGQSKTFGEIRAAQATAAEWRKKTGLPLVVVNPGPSEADEDDEAHETFYAGLLVSAAEDGMPAQRIEPSRLETLSLAAIPAAFWSELETKHGFTKSEDDEEGAGPAEGLFLVPAGWACATLSLGEERLCTTSSEDTYVGKHVADDIIAKFKSGEPVLLQGAYC